MPPARIVIRLGEDDIERFRELNVVFGEAFADPGTYGGEPPADEYLRRLLAKEHVIALVALVENAVVGGLVAYVLDKFERARREIYIYDLAVAQAHRRQGIASSLIEYLRESAATLGAWVIYVQADYGDEPAVALYTRLGVREDVMHFDIPVIGPGDRKPGGRSE
jgi:aminoglycoside 3-N-acetyltransferase I